MSEKLLRNNHISGIIPYTPELILFFSLQLSDSAEFGVTLQKISRKQFSINFKTRNLVTHLEMISFLNFFRPRIFKKCLRQ